MTLHEALERYINHIGNTGKLNSILFARSNQATLENHFGRTFLVDCMDPEAISDFVRMRRSLGRAAPSINANLRTLRAALNFVDQPVRIKMLPVTRKRPSKLTAEELDRLITAAGDGKPEQLAILLAAYAGLRHQEILHLRRSDIDFESNEINVTAKPDVSWNPKNHEERSIPFSPAGRLFHSLSAHCWDMDPDGWLFPGKTAGRPRLTINAEVREAFKHARLYDPVKKPGLHMLRRTFASRLLGRGVDLVTVMELGGWNSVKSVMPYLASSSDQKRTAVDLIE